MVSGTEGGTEGRKEGERERESMRTQRNGVGTIYILKGMFPVAFFLQLGQLDKLSTISQ